MDESGKTKSLRKNPRKNPRYLGLATLEIQGLASTLPILIPVTVQ
jgi:hypothetical protein